MLKNYITVAVVILSSLNVFTLQAEESTSETHKHYSVAQLGELARTVKLSGDDKTAVIDGRSSFVIEVDSQGTLIGAASFKQEVPGRHLVAVRSDASSPDLSVTVVGDAAVAMHALDVQLNGRKVLCTGKLTVRPPTPEKPNGICYLTVTSIQDLKVVPTR